jgi:hypothetical protein
MARKKINPTVAKLRRQMQAYDSVVKEINTQYREFKVGGDPKDRIIRIRFPGLEDEEKVNRLYSKVYGEMLEDSDLKTEDEILEIMKTRKIWTDEKEKRLDLLREKVAFITRTLIDKWDNLTNDEAQKLSGDYENYMEELTKLNEQRFRLVENSIDSRANEVRIKAQLVYCTYEVDEDGKEHKIWETMDDIHKESKRIFLNRCINEALTLWNGVPSNFLESLPGIENGENDSPSAKKVASKSG